MESGSSISLLHISDFHAGQEGASVLWGQIKEQFRADVVNHTRKNGNLDLVIFSGDLTQRGSVEEFLSVKNELNQLWAFFNSHNQNPKLFLIPGNHDLVRPKSDALVLTGIDSFRKRERVKNAILNDEQSEYRIGLKHAFSPYMSFLEDLNASQIPLLLKVHGAIPGDCSGIIEKEGIRIGFVGLNTAWSQLEGGDFFERLEITSHQLSKAIGTEFDEWGGVNHYNMLVTHHPKDWLCPEAQVEFDNEINPLGRFDGHFFGHMHELKATSVGMGGALRKRSFQAASLFSLEANADGKLDRRHGYSFFKIDAEQEQICLWPRKASLIAGGGWRVQADEFALEESDTSFNSEPLPIRKGFSGKKKDHSEQLTVENILAYPSSKFENNMLRARYTLPQYQPHMVLAVSQMAVAEFAEQLRNTRLAWLISPWDTGGDEFLSCIYNSFSDMGDLYSLDASAYKSHDDFVDRLDGKIGCSAVDLCHRLKGELKKTILIDNVPASEGQSGNSIFEEIKSIAEIFIDYCPNIYIVIRTRQFVDRSSIKPTYLRAMDEVDCSRYVLSHPNGRSLNDSEMATGWIFEQSRGLPKAVDRLLDKLRYMNIADIANENSDLAINNVDLEEIPRDLKATIDNLCSSADDDGKRIFALLNCLTVLPFGENVDSIRRFEPDKPFYPKYITKLFEEGLVDSIEFTVFQNFEEKPKVTMLKAAAQDYIRSKFSEDEFSTLTFKAIAFYFGRDWTLGKFKLNACFKLDKYNVSEFAIQNANTLSRRLINDALDGEGSRGKQDALTLLEFYTRKLDASHQYRHLINLCYPIKQKLESLGGNNFSQDILYRYGASLRMLKEFDRAIETYLFLLEQRVTEEFKAKVYLELAYCYQSINDEERSIVSAKKARDFHEKGVISYQAEAIIASFLPVDKRTPKLKKLLKLCKDNGHNIAANNIALDIIFRSAHSPSKVENFRKLAEKAKNEGDIYNHVKSTIYYTDGAVRDAKHLERNEILDLIFAYHFASSQRMIGIFKLSAKSLWSELERLGQVVSLFVLYKQSSLIYRLSADSVTEKEFLTRLTSNPARMTILERNLSDTDAEYLQSRLEQLEVRHERPNSLNFESEGNYISHD